MGLRFRKSVKLLPGVRVNIGKSGISTSIGGKGATINLKPGRKARVTVGIPGSGLSYSTHLDEKRNRTRSQADKGAYRPPDSNDPVSNAVAIVVFALMCLFVWWLL